MSLSSGTRLGPYEILAVLGAGGMGEVYRARDTKLNRDVALKVLPDAFASDAERLARFQREAQLLASLNHPHIAAIYGLEESGGVPAIVLELVEGPTLADRIAQGPIPVDEALTMAGQIAEALEAAHEKGVIHRDLKPANIKLTSEGKVKVLDFGLAKLLTTDVPASSLSMSPTLSVQATYAGVILGTAAYMSPEQARGNPVDRRTDVWAFGCVLFEMLTGRQAFAGGETVSDAVASILKSEPDWNALPAATPSGIRKLLRRCLAKDRRERLHDAADARLDLVDAAAASPETPDAAARSQRPSRRAVALAAIGVAGAIAITVVGTWAYVSRSATPTVVRFFVSPPEKAVFQTGANPSSSGTISPDGRRLAFVAKDASGKLQVWLRSIDALTPQPLPGTEDAQFPFWSPDSRSLGYFARGKLLKIDAAGGPPQTLCDAPQGRGGTWSRDGVIVFGNNGAELQRVASAGGQAAAVTRRGSDVDHRFPSFLPDGRHVLFYVNSGLPDRAGVYVVSLDSGEPKRLVGADTAGIYAQGYLLFVRQGTLVAQAFDPGALEIDGDPFPIAERVESAAFTGVLAFSASDSGTLAYGVGLGVNTNLQMAWIDRQGKPIESVGAPGNYRGIDVSPDGRRVAVHRHEGQGGDIWLMEWARGTTVRLTFDAAQHNSSPVWSADGTEIAFASLRSGKWRLYKKASSGAGNDELLTEADVPIAPLSWSLDGRFIVYRATDPKTAEDLWVLPMSGDRKPMPLLHTPFTEIHGQISPDGKWLAYASNETGRLEIYLIPFPAGVGKWQISINGGYWPRWRRDGRELFFSPAVNQGGKLMAAEVKANGASLEPATPRELFENKYNIVSGGHAFTEFIPYAVSADGQRFLIPQSPSVSTESVASSQIAVVLNWAAGLKR